MADIINNHIYVNRGDKCFVDLKIPLGNGEFYRFQKNDLVSFIVQEKYDGTKNIIKKEKTVVEECDLITFELTNEDTQIGAPTNEEVDYVYDITLNSNTVLGYDLYGKKEFTLLPRIARKNEYQNEFTQRNRLYGYLNVSQGSGKDGISPIAKLEEQEDGINLKIIDVEGEKSAFIKHGRDGIDGKDGRDGHDGYTPIKGKDYWNAEDKESIINDTVDQIVIPTKLSDLTNDQGFITDFSETDPTVPSHVKSITENDISNWNSKSNFDGNYNNLINKPNLPIFTLDGTTLNIDIEV